MTYNLTLGSLFDGSGGFPLGGLMCGIEPIWASEIEPFPILVTTKRLPFMKHYGDINKINGSDIETVDIITFGSPCTDMSIAGKRAGLDGKQSALFHQAVRIIKEMRCKTNGKYPRYIVWENVPGVFSSNNGEDFRCVLESICKIKSEVFSVPRPPKWSNAGEILGDNFSLAWRVLDAQYFGVPQRRKRIYLVADFRGESAGEILFECGRLSRHSAKSFCSWQKTSGDITYCSGTTSKLSLNNKEISNVIALDNHSADSRVTISNTNKVQTLTSTMGTGGSNVPLLLKIRCVCEGGGKGPLIQEDKSGTLSCDNDQTLFEPQSFGICSYKSNAMQSDNPHSGIYEAQITRTVDANGGNPSCNQCGIAIVEGIPFTQNQRNEVRLLFDTSDSLNAASNTKHQTFVLQGSMIGRTESNGPQGNGVNKGISFTLNTVDRHAIYAMTTKNYMQVENENSPTLAARDFKDPNTVVYGIGRDAFNQGKNAKFNPSISKKLESTLISKGPEATCNGYAVRRLTPTECARLQGFPDWWCSSLGTENPSETDMEFWTQVLETHRKIMGKSKKSKSRNQIIKWLKNPHSDSAEYKMWGNGVALPCVYFVLSGIVNYAKTSQTDRGDKNENIGTLV